MTLAVPTPSAGSSDSADELTGDPSIESAVSRLGAEFAARFDRQLVVTVVGDCRRELGGSPIGALPELVERLARYRLGMQIT